MGNNKIYILYASCGQGHKRAAQALAEEFGGDCCILDILNLAPRWSKFIFSQGYNFVSIHLPFLWAFLFKAANLSFFRNLTFIFNWFIFQKLKKEIVSSGAEVVISTHFFASQILSYLKHTKKFYSITVITDFKAHPWWVSKNTDYYVVPFKYTANDLRKYVPKEKIKILGLPLRRQFFNTIPGGGDKKSILILGNGQKAKLLIKLTAVLREQFQLFIICGRNEAFYRYLKKHGQGIIYFRYYENIAELMFRSLCVITKAGGLTSYECLAARAVPVFTTYIRGQEKENLDFFCKVLGVGIYEKDTERIEKAIKDLALGNNENMLSALKEIIIPDSAALLKRFVYQELALK